MSRLRPHTVKASLSDEEKKAIASIAKRHKLSEAELIRFVYATSTSLILISVLQKTSTRNLDLKRFTSRFLQQRKRKSKATRTRSV